MACEDRCFEIAIDGVVGKYAITQGDQVAPYESGLRWLDASGATVVDVALIATLNAAIADGSAKKVCCCGSGAVEAGPCKPAVGEIFGATGEDFEPVLFTSLDVDNPSCCRVKIVTSAGSYTVGPKKFHGLVFDCDVTLTSVSAVDEACDISAVQVVYSKKR